MNGSFSARAMSLGALLSGSAVYAIPGFQRPYSWTTIEVARLLDDLVFAVNETAEDTDKDRVFFLGTMVLIQSGERPADHSRSVFANFDVIDGQQRFVTLTMMFAALRDLARAEGDIEVAARLDEHISLQSDGAEGARAYRVSLWDYDAAVLVEYAQQMDGCLAAADPSEFEGAQRKLIANRNYVFEELRALDHELRRRLAEFLEKNCQVVAISTNDTDNAIRIFTVVNQVGKPLLRNDLLKADLIGALAALERPAYIARWDEAERACGVEFEHLFSHFRAAFGNGRAPIINEIRRLVRQGGGAKSFLDQRLLPAAAVFAAMQGRPIGGAALLTAPVLRSLRYLERLSHTDWVPPALLWACERRDDPEAMARFFDALERHAYGQLVLGIGRDKRIARYGALVDAIRTSGPGLDVIASLLFSAEEQRNILFNATTAFYGRSSIGCKLLLLRLNSAMGGSPLPSDLSDVTVEHVLPQKVGRSSPWRRWFSDTQFSYFAGSLGNLALVTPATNKAVRNFDFQKKCTSYRQDALMLTLPINEGIMTLAQFGPDEIQEREERLMRALRVLWGLTGPVDRRPPR